MPIVHEKPSLLIENFDIVHHLWAVLIDTSNSMRGYENQLTESIVAMKEAIMKDDIARSRVEICLISFDNEVREESPFGPIARMEVPCINCGGIARTHAAVEYALRRIAERKEEYKRNGIAYNQPWIWLFTAGGSDDMDNGSFTALQKAQKDGKAAFFGVAIGDQVNEEELASMHKKGIILKVKDGNLKEELEEIFGSLFPVPTQNSCTPVNISIPENMKQFIKIDA